MDIFEEIIKGNIPSSKIYEDEICVAILDINPFEKGHVLLIPKCNESLIENIDSSILSHLAVISAVISKKLRTALNADDTNILINNGPVAGQEIKHTHIHIIPRFKERGGLMTIQKQKYNGDEQVEFRNKLLISKDDLKR
ncbi:MAG: HIT family protein [Sphaerochaetaceae bacterium]|nr:HIT family protein [Spirochaetales bacterium]MDY5968365.1 HIT family protein [Sphaerochaetaceae bacterium]